MAKKFFIKTYGCQMNVHDSEYMAALLKGMGYIPTSSKEEADIILLNTCTVRKKPEQKAYSFLGRLKYQKRHRPLIIGVGGCLAQQQGELLLKRMPHIDFVFGTQIKRERSARPILVINWSHQRGLSLLLTSLGPILPLCRVVIIFVHIVLSPMSVEGRLVEEVKAS